MRSFYGKLILFGEYSMIFDAAALVIPVKHLAAHWEHGGRGAVGRPGSSNDLLRGFLQYLEQHEQLSGQIETQRFRADLEEGLELRSTIPRGAGLGSSGSVVAAAYDGYALHMTADLLALKKMFAMMESYYHGNSSGLDPLQSFLGRPFISGPEEIRFLPDDLTRSGISIGLIDTGIPRNTKPLVQCFGEKRKDEGYLRAFESEYIPNVTACMNAFVQRDVKSFFEALKALSKSQLAFLRPMIPDRVASLFDSDYGCNLGIKILGAGGGGYMLAFTDDRTRAEELLAGFDVKWV